MKKCSHCQIVKELCLFPKDKNRKQGVHVYCKDCYNKKNREYRLKNPERWKRQKEKNFLKWRKQLGIDPSIKLRKSQGEGYITEQGYLTYKIKGHPCADKNGRVQASHLVMYEHIKRPLFKGESVHHKNGDRLDNRIENLELWSRSQPPGQRVEDKIQWYIEFLNQYGYDVKKRD